MLTGTNIYYINGSGHMNKVAVMPMYGKIFKIFRTRSFMILKRGMKHRGLKAYKVYINDDPRVVLTYFYDKVRFGRLCSNIWMKLLENLGNNYMEGSGYVTIK